MPDLPAALPPAKAALSPDVFRPSAPPQSAVRLFPPPGRDHAPAKRRFGRALSGPGSGKPIKWHGSSLHLPPLPCRPETGGSIPPAATTASAYRPLDAQSESFSGLSPRQSRWLPYPAKKGKAPRLSAAGPFLFLSSGDSPPAKAAAVIQGRYPGDLTPRRPAGMPSGSPFRENSSQSSRGPGRNSSPARVMAMPPAESSVSRERKASSRPAGKAAWSRISAP